MEDDLHLNHRGNRVFGVDLVRHFDAPLNGQDGDYWDEALQIQKLMDRLQGY